MTERLVTLIIISLLTGIVWLSDNLNRGYTLWVAIAALFMSYFTYVWAISWKVRQRQTPHAPNYRPFVTMVVPAKNEEKVIAQTVREMARVVYHNSDGTPNYELMVVDDGSTDHTLQVLESLKPEYPQLVVHHRAPRPKSSKAAVLNEITPIAKGEIFAIFDADARIMPNFLDRIIPYLADPKVGAVQARKQISNPDVNWLTGAQEDELMMLMALEQSRDLVEGAVELRGNGMIVKREALADVGGWNNTALTEDLDMSTRLLLKGWDVRYCPDIAVLEEAVPTWPALFKQRRRWAEGGMRRYAKYFFQLMAPQIPLAKRIDMLVFFCQFAIPIWLMIDVAFMAVDLATGKGFHVSTLMWMLVVMLFVTSVSVANGVRKVVTRNWWQVIYRTARHEFFALHWFPVIFVTVFHILFARRPMEWTKTEHHGEPDTAQV